MPKKKIFESGQALHEAFVEHCNKCDCPMGCVHRRETDPRFLLDTRCGSILDCFARFVVDNLKTRKSVTQP